MSDESVVNSMTLPTTFRTRFLPLFTGQMKRASASSAAANVPVNDVLLSFSLSSILSTSR
jgi:hypothetical protein